MNAVILAAGMGKRVGMPKALLPIGNDIFLTYLYDIVDSMVDNIVCVVNDKVHDYMIQNKIKMNNIINKNPDSEMTDSLRLGLSELKRLYVVRYKKIDFREGILVFPVDHPYVKPETIRKLIHEYKGDQCIVPLFNGMKGHPVIITINVAKTIFENPELTLKDAIDNAGFKGIEVKDAGVVKNINKIEDLII